MKPMALLPLQTPVRLPARNLCGRITGYERVAGAFRCDAVECAVERNGRSIPFVVFVGPEEVKRSI